MLWRQRHTKGGAMGIKNLLAGFILGWMILPAGASELFFEDETVRDGLPIVQLSENFADIYQKLDGVNWAGKSLEVAIESLENLHPNAHIAATDERVVLVWGDSIVANFPRPEKSDWNSYGEITTALILKMRENDKRMQQMNQEQLLQVVVQELMHGIDESGRYVIPENVEMLYDDKILTSLGIEGVRDEFGNFRVQAIIKGAPADNAGIHSGDLIAQINGRDVKKMSDAQVAVAFDGFNSGTCKLKLLTPTGNRDVVLRRATIVLADADIVHRESKETGAILEIVVHKISDGAVDIINRALAQYDDVSGIVLDLRASIGDDERAMAKLAGLFIGKEPVMRIIETARDEVEVIPGGNAITDVPVVVLVSDTTRGTAEALAVAFYEYERGVLVGTPTAGDAKLISKIKLNNGGVLELQNRAIKSGKGRNIDGRGVFPIVCLSNIRSEQQQNAFFLNVVNDNFNARDFNQETDISVKDIRRGCPVITSGADEDALATAVSVKILTDKKVYSGLSEK